MVHHVSTEELAIIIAIFGVVALLLLPFFVADTKKRQRALSEWEKLTGKVTSILYGGYPARTSSVCYSYVYNGKEYKSRDLPNRYQSLRNLKEGSEITLLVNPNDPTKTYIWAPSFQFFDSFDNRSVIFAIIFALIIATLWFFLGPPNV